jgi:hypothetical protein
MSDDRYDPYEALHDLDRSEGFAPLEDPAEPPARPPRRGAVPPFLVGLILGVVLIGMSLAVFSLFAADPDETSSPGATTTTSAATTTTQPGATTTEPVASTTSTATTTTTLPGFEAIGDPIDIGDLALVVDGIGPLDFGMAATDVMGSLVATFGVPTEDTGIVVSEGQYGTCEGDAIRVVRWGLLAAIITSPDLGGGLFDGYRVDLSYAELTHPTSRLATYSGLSIGDTVGDLEDTYAAFDISYRVDSDPDVGQVFELRSSDGRLLLWGPLTSADPDEGVVRGIYAPDVCDR